MNNANTEAYSLYMPSGTAYSLAFVLFALSPMPVCLPDIPPTTGTVNMTMVISKEDVVEEVAPASSTDCAEEDADEREWMQQFANSEDFLSHLVSEVREERRQGILLPLEVIFDD